MTKEQLFIKLVDTLNKENLFFGHAVIDAEDEAMMVLMSVLKQSPQEILSTGSEVVDSISQKQAIQFVEARVVSNKPMAYILGRVHFAGIEFLSDERALVPRSPIAELIINGFNDVVDISTINTALDLCTGSGCIGIALANYYKQIQIDITDISSEALSLARENVQALGLKDQVNVIQSNLFDNLVHSYDLIVSNPPYVSEGEYKELPKEYKLEPKLGLTTSLDGMKIPLEILVNAADYLNDNGYLILEVGYTDELLNDTFPNIEFKWLKFVNGGQGVCVFSKEMLLKYRPSFLMYLNNNR